MVQFYAEILRSILFRDNNFKPLASNDPSTTTTSLSNHGLTLSTNGDVLSVTHGGVGNYASESVFGGTSVSTTNWPYIVFRAKGSGIFNFSLSLLGITTAGPFSTTVTGQWTTYTVKMSTGISFDSIAIGTGSMGDQIGLDYIAVCGKAPVQISQTDLISGTVTRTSFGADHAELRLNNHRGKYVVGSSSSVAPGFGDHLHIYLAQPSIASTNYSGPPLHVYGGYVEYQEPIQPNDEMMINSRGFGVALQEMLVENQPSAAPIYTNQTPQQIFNDFIDNHVNNPIKNGITGIVNFYQITRAYVQNIGSSIPLYVSQFKTVWDSMKEIADLTVAQGSPGVFFVDPAENLHFVPLGAQGSANWVTDPIPSNYGTALSLGSNLVTYRFRRDVQSLRNRVHYFGVSQNPGKYGAWTEQAASSWGSERLISGTTATFSDDNSIVATGKYSVKCILSNSGSAHYGGAMFYPASKNLGLNITSLGSVYAPALFDFYFRVTQGANCKTTQLGSPPTIFFATDSSDRFEYNFVSDGNTAALQSILGVQGINNVTDNYWYHALLPIGPNGGVLFNSTPVANTVAPSIYTGASQYQRTNVGNPSWNNINYIGVYWEDSGGCGNTSGSAPFWHNGWRIIGGRYILAYDNRTSPPRYPDTREIHFYDPITKDDTALNNYAIAELKRLRNPIVRGTITTPLLAGSYPEQQVQVTTPSANYSNTYLRATSIVHRFSPQGMLTEFQLSDDFTNSQPLDLWKLSNALLQMGENAIISREVYDLKTAILDPTFTPQLIAVT
jgi:hypothetical protein